MTGPAPHGERRPPRRLTRAEVLAEVEWLLDGGVHPLLICQELQRKAESIEVAARRLGNARVARAMLAAVKEQRKDRERGREQVAA